MEEIDDLSQALVLDANAAAGLLDGIFFAELTAAPAECAFCGRQGEVGSLLAFMKGPGVVLRCPACQNVVLRVVETPRAVYLDARGAAYLCLYKERGLA